MCWIASTSTWCGGCLRWPFLNDSRFIMRKDKKANWFTSMFVGDVRNNRQRVDVYASGERDSLLSEGQHSERNNHWPTTSIPSHEIHSPGCHFPSTVWRSGNRFHLWEFPRKDTKVEGEVGFILVEYWRVSVPDQRCHRSIHWSLVGVNLFDSLPCIWVYS